MLRTAGYFRAIYHVPIRLNIGHDVMRLRSRLVLLRRYPAAAGNADVALPSHLHRHLQPLRAAQAFVQRNLEGQVRECRIRGP